MTARIGAYARWQLRDYAVGAGGATAALAIIILALSGAGFGPPDPDARAALLLSVLNKMAVIGAVAGVTGLVAEDRARGYYRFALARPVSAARLYGQAFAVRGVGLVLLIGALWIVGTVLLGSGSVVSASLPRLLACVIVSYLLVGGVTFLVSTMTRYAWLATLAVAASSLISSLLADVPSWSRRLWVVVTDVLPPFNHLASVLDGVLGTQPTPHLAGVLAWVAGYGVLAIAAALAVLAGQEWPR
jgi:hypothetical protein